jgi:EpsI family protein
MHAFTASHPRPLPSIQAWMAVVLMLGAGLLGHVLRPNDYWADVSGKPNLESLVPNRFGDWVGVPFSASSVVDPQQKEALDVLYDETMTRVYVHRTTGRRIMLAMAYGKNQNTATAVHPPEACYRSQGFRVGNAVDADIDTPVGVLKASRLLSENGLRTEPVTYFIRTGHRVTRGSLDRSIVRLQYAAAGYIADGLLVRVSEITTDPPRVAFTLQDSFIEALLQAMSSEGRRRVAGGANPFDNAEAP